MNPAKLLAICTFGAATALTAGCASSPRPSASAATPAPSVAATQRSIQSGKVSAVESVAVINQTTIPSSSGTSTVVTAASGGPVALTVQFADGNQGRYILEHPTTTFNVGEPVNVITDGDRIAIMPNK